MWNLCISFNWYRLLSVFHLMKSTFFSSFCSWYLSFLILKCESKHGARISYLCESANITTCVGSVFVPENITFYPTKSELAQIIRCRNKIKPTVGNLNETERLWHRTACTWLLINCAVDGRHRQRRVVVYWKGGQDFKLVRSHWCALLSSCDTVFFLL